MTETMKLERLKTEPQDIQRWEDEGGQMNEHNELMTDQLLMRPLPINTGRHDKSLQWNKRFTIEPFHAGNGMFWKRKKHTTTIGSS
jgi:hypothetical protein